MVENMYEIKNQIIQRVQADINERGVENMDVVEVGKMIDMVKDLAEAEKSCWESEYYRSVTEAMRESQMDYGSSSGYGSQGFGYSRGRMGWQNQYGSGQNGRRGYNQAGYMPQEEMFANMKPEEKMRLAERLMQQDGSM